MTNRVLISANDFKVSKVGENVLTVPTSDPQSIQLDSGYRNAGVWFTGSASVPANNDVFTVVMFPYDLGYVPVVLTMQSPSSGTARHFTKQSPGSSSHDVVVRKDRMHIFSRTIVAGNSIKYAVLFAKGADAT